MSDMTPAEIKAAIDKLCNEIGRDAYISVCVTTTGRDHVYATLYPDGVGLTSETIAVNSPTFREAVAALRVRCSEHRGRRLAAIVRDMAKHIIEITNKRGACTDATLKMVGNFSDDDIRQYGNAACREANQLASNGPFEIIAAAGQKVNAA